MAWYRSGTVSVTNGSAVVTGANTDFVSNTQQGEAFLGPDGRNYEVAAVISATQLTLGSAYQGASAAGQGYALMPTSSFARDLALGAAQLLNTFAGVRDGVGAGMFPGGSVATPAMRFSADQDTGVYLYSTNTLAIAAGGAISSLSDANGFSARRLYAGFGAALGVAELLSGQPAPAVNQLVFGTDGTGYQLGFGKRQGGVVTQYMALTDAGNLLVGTPGNTFHYISKTVAEGASILGVGQYGSAVVIFNRCANNLFSAAGAAIQVPVNSSTGRSINAGGTINANGADYAEYMIKADGCGTIAAGDVCGVDIEGKLTRHWGTAISFVVKSTDPSLVGGDVWGAHLGPKPEAPGPEPIAPGDAPAMPDNDAPEALASWREAAIAHNDLVIAYPAEHAAWVSAQANYETAIEVWENALETARQCVDRIAFCGQVPVNVAGEFAVGDYIVAAANGSGINAVAVAEADITFDQYRRRIGKVWTVRDGRAWIDVQHG